MSSIAGTPEGDLLLGRKAVERGWLSLVQLEAALERTRTEPAKTLLDHLGLSEQQLGELREAPPSTRSIPPEVAAVAADPARRIGRYVRMESLGQGGMGDVFRAWDTSLCRWVALKCLARFGDETSRAYFRREALLAASLDHPNIVKVYEVGEHEGAPFLAMQLIEGQTLGDRAKTLRLAEIVAVVRRIAEAIRHAHERKIIHRDLKPSNVMVDRTLHVFVMDFGLAKEVSVDGRSLGGSGAVLGTPQYMSPEQARGQTDEQSDVYGIGAILYEAVTGRPPFVGRSVPEVMAQVLDSDPVWPRRLAPNLPQDVEAIILKSMERDKSRRYASAARLVEDLEAYESGEPLVHARRPTWSYVLAKKIRRQPFAWTFAAAAVLSLLAGAVFGAAQLRRAALEKRHKEETERAAARREDDQRRLAVLWMSVVERHRALREGRLDPIVARRELEEAVDAVDRFAALRPDMPQARYVRARAAYYVHRRKQAETDLRRALALAPDFRPAWTLLGIVKIEDFLDVMVDQMDRREEQREAARRAREEGVEALGRGWEAGRELEEAVRWGLPWSREDRVAARIAEALRAAYAGGGSQRAIQILEAAWGDYKAEEYARLLASLKGDAEWRIHWATEAIRWASGYAEAYHVRGFARMVEDDLEAALADFDQAIRWNPALGGAYFGRARVRQKRGDPAGAVADFSRALDLHPDDPDVLFNRARARYDAGDRKGAIADYDRLLRVEPDGWTHSARGIARRELGDFAGAAADFAQAVSLKPDWPAAWGLHAHGRYEIRAWDDAARAFRKLGELDDAHRPYAELYLWLIEARQGRREAASRALRSFFEGRTPRAEESWVRRIASHLLGDLPEEEFLASARSAEERCEAHFYAGSRRLIDGDRPVAAQHFRAAVDAGASRVEEHFDAAAELEALK